MEPSAATCQEFLAEVASHLQAASGVLELLQAKGASAETLASFGASPHEGDGLTWIALTVREGPAEVAQLRLGFPAGARLSQRALIGLLVGGLAPAGLPSLRAGRRFLAVTEEELQRIILDVHDGPVQKLFAALSQIDLLKSRHPGESQLAAGLAQISSLVESSLGEIRTGLGTFRPPGFRTRPLISVLKGLVMQHEALTDMHVALTVEGEIPPVTIEVKIALYRILQEALSNVTRHAKVDRLEIRLAAEDQWVALHVSDTGRGFDPPALDGPQATELEQHIGLRGMRERTELVGGRFQLSSQPGEGTHIEVRVPADV